MLKHSFRLDKATLLFLPIISRITAVNKHFYSLFVQVRSFGNVLSRIRGSHSIQAFSVSCTVTGLCEGMEYKDNTYLPHSCFYRFGIHSFYGRSGKGGILVSVGGRHYWRVDNVSGRSVCFYQLFPALLLLISISTLCLYKFAPSAMFFPASAVPIPYITMGVCHTMPE